MQQASYLARGNGCFGTKRNLMEIPGFQHFAPYVGFNTEGDKYRNKRINKYITVSVVIDMVYENTRNE